MHTISSEFTSSTRLIADMSQALLMFINFYKEVETLSAVPMAKDGFKHALSEIKT